MTYNEIQAFLEVVRCGSLSQAAQSLFVSQSTLSGRILSLESELGVTLLVRRRGVRSVELTEEGRDFIPIAQKWRRLWNDTLAITTRHGLRVLRVASIYTINTYMMPEVYSRFYRENPDVKLNLMTYHSYEIYHMVESGEVQLGFITRTEFSAKVETTPLFIEPLQLICSADSPYHGQVHPAQLDPDRELMLSWSREFDAWHDYWFGANPHPAVLTDDASLLAHFMRSGCHWSVLPLSVAQKLKQVCDVRFCQLLEPPEPRRLYLLSPAGESLTPEGQQLLRTMRDALHPGSVQWQYAGE